MRATNDALEELGIQGKIRTLAEAFLSRKVIVCEGATEVGFLRGFDDYKLEQGSEPMCYQGVELIDARGAKNIVGISKAFKALSYEVAVFADSDSQENFSTADEEALINLNISVVTWDDELALEERAFTDIPWDSVLSSLDYAENELNCDIWNHVTNAYQSPINKDFRQWDDNNKFRTSIGKAAKKRGWYKSTSNGEGWCNVISDSFKSPCMADSDLVIKLNNLWDFVKND